MPTIAGGYHRILSLSMIIVILRDDKPPLLSECSFICMCVVLFLQDRGNQKAQDGAEAEVSHGDVCEYINIHS